MSPYSRTQFALSAYQAGGIKKGKLRVFCIAAKPGAGDKSNGPKASVHLLKNDKDGKKGKLTGSSSWKLSQLSRIDGGQADPDGARHIEPEKAALHIRLRENLS